MVKKTLVESRKSPQIRTFIDDTHHRSKNFSPHKTISNYENRERTFYQRRINEQNWVTKLEYYILNWNMAWMAGQFT